ncbi:hypothetical protein HD554DRAFT_2267066 [Boletus coccyginus]|nr:hypothetical protein HD554DRAFT_2267066 [Boletus coccyginus]
MATIITSSPLPALDSPRIQELSENAKCYSAYSMILQAEQHALQEQVREDIMSARVVGYFLLELHAQKGAFGEIPCDTLVKWVTMLPQSAGDTHNVIIGVGKVCHDKFIRTFRTSNTQYPTPSLHPSRPSFDTLEDMIKDSMECTDKDYKTSRKQLLMLNQVLARDGYWCVITGMIDENSLHRCADLGDSDDKVPVAIEVAHILNESMMQGIDPAGTSAEAKTYYAAGAMAMLETFGWSKFTEAFKQQGGVHKVWNLLSLEHNLHCHFDTLSLWFESTSQLNHYKVCVAKRSTGNLIYHNFVAHKHMADGAPIVVEFNAKYPNAPPPDPLLLALHATCA